MQSQEQRVSELRQKLADKERQLDVELGERLEQVRQQSLEQQRLIDEGQGQLELEAREDGQQAVFRITTERAEQAARESRLREVEDALVRQRLKVEGAARRLSQLESYNIRSEELNQARADLSAVDGEAANLQSAVAKLQSEAAAFAAQARVVDEREARREQARREQAHTLYEKQLARRDELSKIRAELEQSQRNAERDATELNEQLRAARQKLEELQRSPAGGG